MALPDGEAPWARQRLGPTGADPLARGGFLRGLGAVALDLGENHRADSRDDEQGGGELEREQILREDQRCERVDVGTAAVGRLQVRRRRVGERPSERERHQQSECDAA